METVTVQAQLNRESLLQAVSQLSSEEFEKFFKEVLTLRARQQAHCLPTAEVELIKTINQTLSEPEQAEYQVLLKKRQAETLTEVEYQMLVNLSDRLDELHAQRMSALAKLGQVRQKSLPEMMAAFGIPVSKS
ncbi:MAG: STAS/SEC14 domain-containing protein [Spirulina sp. SIO3F2]|nr:STAS/SEC14 domain-containing protein [Spirulina sp. SIO3F2]